MAAFKGDVVSGCSPLRVNFQDQSTGAPISWNWDFGNGQLSNQQNPTGYFYPGTYTITLVVRNSAGISSLKKDNYIVSNSSPIADFTSDKTISCLPGSIQLKDASIAGTDPINKWEWNLGDGTTADIKDPVHAYTNPGFYDVYLRVTSSSGCQGAIAKQRFIRMVNGVKADFSTTGPGTCKPPYNITFNNLTSGPGTLTYAWDLATTTSTAKSPSNTYSTANTYNINLTVKSDLGCSDSIQRAVPISGPTVSFTSSTDKVCLGGPVSFTSNLSPAPTKVLWDFGDGTSSTQLNPPAKKYATAGTYPVKLYGTFVGCADSSVPKSIVVSDKPLVNFYAANNNFFCKPPAAVVFQNLSPGVATAVWDFGDGTPKVTTTGATNVTHTYTGSLPHYDVSLTITNATGCTNTLSSPSYVNIIAPTINIGGVPKGLCNGQAFQTFNSGPTVNDIASYSWDFGDGSALDASPSPVHSYPLNGTYTVKLTIMTASGCPATASTVVTVGDRPKVDFDKSTAVVCHSTTVVFTNLSTPVAGSTYLWDFGDKTSSTQQAPSHKFADTGSLAIKLIVTTKEGCADSAVKADFVKVLPPVANFEDTVLNCLDKNTVTFRDSSLNNVAGYGPLTYSWNFGDGTPVDLSPAPVHTFPSTPSLYNVQLTVNNAITGCTDVITKPVQLINEKALLGISKTVACRNEPVIFYSNNNPAFIKTFNWKVDGVDSITPYVNNYRIFGITGNHTVQLIITDINGCTDASAIFNFTVTGPTAQVSAGNNGGCKNRDVVFTDASITSPPGSIVKWTANFGDGKTQSFTNPVFPHAYTDTGTYSVLVTVLDNNSVGCIDTFRLPIVITNPAAVFSANATTFCPGIPLQFTDSSSGGGLTYAWDFGDGATANTQNPQHIFTGGDSAYTVKLAIRDSIGCVDTLSRSKYIVVRTPKPFYTVKDTATLCPPLETKFTFAGKDVDSFYWDFGDGGSSTLAKTSHFYNVYGNFTAKLFVIGYGGCLDSSNINITLTDPIQATNVTYDPNPAIACNNLTVKFNVTPPYATSFTLLFGDGSADSSQQTNITHNYTLPNLYSPVVLLQDSVGCKITKGGLPDIRVLGAVPLFGADKKKFCDSGSVYMTDFSQDGTDPIISRSWDFGDGSAPVSLPKDAQHTYLQPGLYFPTLSVNTASMCTSKFSDTIRVLATPEPVITSDDGVCSDKKIIFTASLLVPPDTAIVWKWDLGGGKTSDLQSVTVNYPDTGVHHITLQATNSLGCKGDTTKDIIVYPLPSIKVVGDTTAVSGGVGLTLPVTYSNNVVSYNWTPPATLSCADCPSPFANPKYSTTYTVNVTDDKGCVSSRNITLVVTCSNKNFFIPNTFSPNNDGSNDRFYPRGTGLNLIQAMRIFNRWGELVFEKRNFPANDPSSGWNGFYKGKAAPTDTYIYMIDIICDNANVITYKANVTLIR